MAIKELKLNLENSKSHITITGRREVLSKTLEGSWATLFKGRGMEFTGYRQYSYTDDASTIDWRATLRSKETLVRVFEEYKNYNIYFYLDTSNSMLFTSGEFFKAEFGAGIMYSLSEEANASGDAVGMGMFNDSLKETIQPAYGRGMRPRFVKLLNNKENYGGIRDFKKSILQLSASLGERSIIIILSDFLGLPDDWSKYISMLSEEHHVMGIMIRDKRDRFLPTSGQFFLKDPNSDSTIYVDAKQFAQEYADLSKESEQKVISVFKKVRSDCLILENETPDPKSEIRKFFNKLSHLEH